MQLGFVGLGKMGYQMVKVLLEKDHGVFVYDTAREKIDAVARFGATRSNSLTELAEQLAMPRRIWIMVPSQAIDGVLEELTPALSAGDILVDGGNSYYKDTLKRGDVLEENGVHYVDCGTSGGLHGAMQGYCLMYGGTEFACQELKQVFDILARKNGHARVGARGAGHYAKMVHNAIEYGMMQAIGEGLEILKKGPYSNIDFENLCELWNHGSIVRGFLMNMTVKALQEHPDMADVAPYVAETGEGKWALLEAIENKISANTLALSLFARWQTQQDDSYAAKIVAALREQFGGHDILKKI